MLNSIAGTSVNKVSTPDKDVTNLQLKQESCLLCARIAALWEHPQLRALLNCHQCGEGHVHVIKFCEWTELPAPPLLWLVARLGG